MNMKSYMPVERIRKLDPDAGASRLSVRHVRSRAQLAYTPEVLLSSVQMRQIVSKYFMGDEKEISGKMASSEVRERLEKDLVVLRDLLQSDVSFMQDEGTAIQARKGAMLKKVVSFAAGALATLSLGYLANSIWADAARSMPVLLRPLSVAAMAAGTLIMAACAHASRMAPENLRLSELSGKVESVREFAETVIDFALQEWKAKVRDVFRQ